MSDKLQFVVTHEEGLRQIEAAGLASGNDKLKKHIGHLTAPTKVPILVKIPRITQKYDDRPGALRLG